MSDFDAGWFLGAFMMACLWLSAIGFYQWGRWRRGRFLRGPMWVIQSLTMPDGEYQASILSDDCRVFWGSHGCDRPRGHAGPHVCDGCWNPADTEGYVGCWPYYGPDTRFFGDDADAPLAVDMAHQGPDEIHFNDSEGTFRA